MPWRVVGVCAHAPEGLVGRSCSWSRTLGVFRHLPVFRGPYLTSHHDDRTPPHITLDDVIIWLDDGARGVVCDDGNDGDDGGDDSREVPPVLASPHARGRTGGRAGGRATTHARAVVRTGRRWDVRAVARVRALMSVGVSFVSYRRATPARHRAAHIEECIGKWGFRAVGRLKPRGPAIRRPRSKRLTEAEAQGALKLVPRT